MHIRKAAKVEESTAPPF